MNRSEERLTLETSVIKLLAVVNLLIITVYNFWLSLRKPFKNYLFIFRGFEGRYLPHSYPGRRLRK